MPLQNAGGHCHILQAAIGTAANVDLIEWGALHLLYGVNIINALRAGKIGHQLLCPVVQFPDIVGIRIGMDPGDLLQRQVKVIGGFLVSGKSAVLQPASSDILAMVYRPDISSASMVLPTYSSDL